MQENKKDGGDKKKERCKNIFIKTMIFLKTYKVKKIIMKREKKEKYKKRKKEEKKYSKQQDI